MMIRRGGDGGVNWEDDWGGMIAGGVNDFFCDLILNTCGLRDLSGGRPVIFMGCLVTYSGAVALKFSNGSHVLSRVE